MFDKNKCWYKNVCSLFNTSECYRGCERYLEFYHLIEGSKLPIKYQNVGNLKPEVIDENSFLKLNEIKNNILDYVNEGENVYMYSKNCGNGKTSWAAKILLKYFDLIWSGNGLRDRGLFIHVPTFLRDRKTNINKNSKSFLDFEEKIKYVDFIIWDDIAVSALSDFDHDTLLSYIDGRINQMKFNIFTGNLNSDSLFEKLGGRLHSRIFSNSLTVEFKGQDRRFNRKGKK